MQFGEVCIKKKLFENNKIRFDSNLRYGEDWAVLIDLLTNSDKIKLFHKQFYLYNNQNESSFLNTMTFDKLSNLMFAFSTIANMKNIRKYSDILRNTRLNLIYTTISTCIYIDQSVSEINTHIDKIFEISNKPSLYDIFNSDIVFKRKILLVSYMSTIVRTILFKIIQFNKK